MYDRKDYQYAHICVQFNLKFILNITSLMPFFFPAFIHRLLYQAGQAYWPTGLDTVYNDVLMENGEPGVNKISILASLKG